MTIAKDKLTNVKDELHELSEELLLKYFRTLMQRDPGEFQKGDLQIIAGVFKAKEARYVEPSEDDDLSDVPTEELLNAFDVKPKGKK